MNSHSYNSTNFILLVRPKHFGENLKTTNLNGFQEIDKNLDESSLQAIALKEFNLFVSKLLNASVTTLVIEDSNEHKLESAIYPNNWFSTHTNGDVYIYSMNHLSRRKEKYLDIFSHLNKRFFINKTFDLSLEEAHGKFLEGTGSMVFDRVHKIAYATISERTNEHLFHEFCKKINFHAISFNAKDELNRPIYHTNVMLSITSDLAIVCLESIKDEAEKLELLGHFERTNKVVIDVTNSQMKQFCCNVLEVLSSNGNKLLVMSETAFKSFNDHQIKLINQFCTIIHSDLSNIERIGGGGARCMMAEIFLPLKKLTSL